jgi:putative ABC transport system permease protein
MGNDVQNSAYTPAILTETLKREYPEVRYSVRIQNFSAIVSLPNENKVLDELKIAGADKEIFQLFSLPLLKGNVNTSLENPNTAVITESIAKKYFGDSDPVNQVIEMYGDEFTITGIVDDIPPNSHFHFDVFVSVVTFPWIHEQGWTWNSYKTYVQLNEKSSQVEFERKIETISDKYIMNDAENSMWRTSDNYYRYFLQPLKSIHLNSDLIGEIEPNGNGTYISIFSFVAIFILIIAGINYTNLSTVRSVNRGKEVGIRKVVGSNKSPLIIQFLTESCLYAFISLIIALPVVILLLPYFSDLVGKPLNISFLNDPMILIYLFVAMIIIGIGSGAYPAFSLSSFKPVTILKGNQNPLGGGSKLRNILVVFQFSISTILLVGTYVIYKQLTYIQDKELGFDKEQVLVVNTWGLVDTRYKPLKDLLQQKPGVMNVSTSQTLPGKEHSNRGFRSFENEPITLDAGACDPDYLDILKLEMVQGRFFSEEFPGDSTAVVINEQAAKLLGPVDPVGKFIRLGNDARTKLKVIGVVKDYHYESLHQTINPLVLLQLPGAFNWSANYVSIRISTSNVYSTIDHIKDTWLTMLPDVPFEYSFLDEDFNDLYVNDNKARIVFALFAFLAITIGCLGLLGLSAFIVVQKTKEIGVRKVLGATIPGILTLLIRKLLKWILIANIIAWPAAYYLVNYWLQDFAYRIDITLWPFFISGTLTFFIALMTVGYQSIKAALANPVESLKYE